MVLSAETRVASSAAPEKRSRLSSNFFLYAPCLARNAARSFSACLNSAVGSLR